LAGATLDDTLTQVTNRLERKLQETKRLDFLRSDDARDAEQLTI
jgi:multidrug efflux pump subunit AcrB